MSVVIHGAMQLLPISGDKGDGISLIQQANYILYLLRRPLQLLGQPLYNDIHFKSCSFAIFPFSVPKNSRKVQARRSSI